ncbi:MAG: tetratricopeptide repeat protein [Alphaproteobacteria bacterium]
MRFGAKIAVLVVVVNALALPATARAECPHPPNECPMFGGIEKNEDMKRADETFIEKTDELGLSREEGAKVSIKLGWKYFLRADYASAMKRFNQAWVLDPSNGDIYHGMAAVVAERDKDVDAADALFQESLNSSFHSPGVLADYGYFLIRSGRPQNAENMLRDAIENHPDAQNLRYNLAIALLVQGKNEQACRAGRDAREAGDQVEDGFLTEACGAQQ